MSSRTIQLSVNRGGTNASLKTWTDGPPDYSREQAHRGSVADRRLGKLALLPGEATFRGTFVELIGIEPTTSGLQSQRSPN